MMKSTYGKSMYGGWYAQTIEYVDGKPLYLSARTLKELKEIASVNNVSLDYRMDN